jgi:hypothetical protein
MKRKGELSPARIDRDWRHQIVLKANDCTEQSDMAMREFCTELSLCPRGHSYVENDLWMRVFCFAEKAHAETFQARFGGAWFDLARRRAGPGWSRLKESKKKFY